MDKYELSSDECDYRLIRINNCLQMLACFCQILAIFMAGMRDMARFVLYCYYLGWIRTSMFTVPVLIFSCFLVLYIYTILYHRLISCIADLFYHMVSGCMTAQVKICNTNKFINFIVLFLSCLLSFCLIRPVPCNTVFVKMCLILIRWRTSRTTRTASKTLPFTPLSLEACRWINRYIKKVYFHVVILATITVR